MRKWLCSLLGSAIALAVAMTILVVCQPQSALRAQELNDRMIRVVEHTPLTDEVYRSVARGLNFLPPDVKQSFVDAKVCVVITPTIERAGIPGARSEYSPATRSVIICEQNSDGSRTDFRRLHIITLHELGHAFDQLLGYPSRSSEFRAIYEQEAPGVPSEYQQVLSYFLQPGTAGPRECFATLFACKYYQGQDRRLTALKASFPQSFAYVQNLHLTLPDPAAAAVR